MSPIDRRLKGIGFAVAANIAGQALRSMERQGYVRCVGEDWIPDTEHTNELAITKVIEAVGVGVRETFKVTRIQGPQNASLNSTVYTRRVLEGQGETTVEKRGDFLHIISSGEKPVFKELIVPARPEEGKQINIQINGCPQFVNVVNGTEPRSVLTRRRGS